MLISHDHTDNELPNNETTTAPRRKTIKSDSAAKPIYKTKNVKIADIRVDERKRKISEPQVVELMNSIRVAGLLQPVVVTPDLRLRAGAHRLEACRGLGMRDISATIVPDHAPLAKLAEIEENVVRHELTVLQRCFQLKEQKELHELLNPQTGKGKYDREKPKPSPETEKSAKSAKTSKKTAPPKTANSAAECADGTGISDKVVAYAAGSISGNSYLEKSISDNFVAYTRDSFAAKSAKQTRVSKRTVERAIFIAANLDLEAVELLGDLPIADNANHLQQLARFAPERQKEVALKIAVGDLSFAEAVRQTAPVADEPADRADDEPEDRAHETTGSAVAVSGAAAENRITNSTAGETGSSVATASDSALTVLKEDALYQRLFAALTDFFEHRSHAPESALHRLEICKTEFVLDSAANQPLARFFECFAHFVNEHNLPAAAPQLGASSHLGGSVLPVDSELDAADIEEAGQSEFFDDRDVREEMSDEDCGD